MPKRILVVDDEKETVEMIGKFLERKNHNVDCAFDGKAGLDLIEANDYDFIFADHNMPELTGLELIRYVKENKPDSKIVMITGYPEMERVLPECLGADGYIEKPVQLEAIQKIIEGKGEENDAGDA